MPMTGRVVVQSTIALFAIGLFTLLAIVASTIWLGERSRIYFDEVIAARDTRSVAVDLRNALRTAESSQRGYLFTNNEIYLAPYDTAKAQASARLDSLRRLLPGYPGAEAMLRRLDEVVPEKIAEMDETITLKNSLRDQDSLALVQTNRGKALMDEANVFLSGIIQATDDRLTTGVSEQRANAAMLRWVSIGGGLVIILVVVGVIFTVASYTTQIRQARDEVRSLNAGLEQRVSERTSALALARDRAEVLLAEVNHRVANSLTLVASLVKLQANVVKDPAARDALAETQARIFAIASVHKRLYTSGDVRVVPLDEYLSNLLDQLATSMRNEGLGASLRYELEPVKLPTDASVNLGVVVTELVTNAYKYAYPGGPGEVRVRLKLLSSNTGELVVEDDGIGRSDEKIKGTGVGTRIVKAMATTMGAEVQSMPRQPGTAVRLTFPLQQAA
jgi:two-component sensor histidine kinase